MCTTAWVLTQTSQLGGYVWLGVTVTLSMGDDGGRNDEAEDWLQELLQYNREALKMLNSTVFFL